MNNFKSNPISSALGLLIVAFAGVLLFIPTLYSIPLWGIGLIAVCGILLFSAEDKFISILTLGLSRFVKTNTGGSDTQKKIGGELPKDDDEG
jgi:hypothetical protein